MTINIETKHIESNREISAELNKKNPCYLRKQLKTDKQLLKKAKTDWIFIFYDIRKRKCD